MSFVTVNEAATLTGKSKQTIYRHIKDGKLSRESNGQIQTAELLRVYGELKQSEPLRSNEKQDDVIALLQHQVLKLENDLRELKTESLERERQAVEREKRLMALLEHQANISDEKTGGIFRKLFG